MKKILSKIEYMVVVAIIVLSFFPWIGLLNASGVDITRGVIENITSLASIDHYAIAVTVIMAVFAIVMEVLKKGNTLYLLITFVSPLVAFVYGMVMSSGDYFSSMELAYMIVVVLSVIMLFKKAGFVKF